MADRREYWMKLQIDETEFEETEETKRAFVRSRVEGAIDRLNYLDNIYQLKEQGIQNRKKNLKTMCLTWLGVSAAWALLGLFIYSMTVGSMGFAFSVTTIYMCYLMAVIFLLGTIRIFASLQTHMMKWSAPVRLVYNRKYKQRTLQDLQRSGIYTLAEETRDCRLLLRQVSDNRKCLQNYLNNPESTIEEGEELLKGMEVQLEENEKRATVLYGERV